MANTLSLSMRAGYADPLHWHSDGWSWVVENQTYAPLYWHQEGGRGSGILFQGMNT